MNYVRPESEWPPCPTPDCENGICQWAGLGVCHPCSVRLVGQAEMDHRYWATRVDVDDTRWNGQVYNAEEFK